MSHNANGLPNNPRIAVPTTVPLPPHPFLMSTSNSSGSSGSSKNNNNSSSNRNNSSNPNLSSAHSSKDNSRGNDNSNSSNCDSQSGESRTDNGGGGSSGSGSGSSTKGPTIQIPPPLPHQSMRSGRPSTGSRSSSGQQLGPPMSTASAALIPQLFREISANTQDELRTLLLPGPDSMGGSGGSGNQGSGGNGNGADSYSATFLDSINSNSSFLNSAPGSAAGGGREAFGGGDDASTSAFAASATSRGYKPNLARTHSDGLWGPTVDIEKSSSTCADKMINDLDFADGGDDNSNSSSSSNRNHNGSATRGIATGGSSSSSTAGSNNSGFSPSFGSARPPLLGGATGTPQKESSLLGGRSGPMSNALEMLSAVAYHRSTSMEGEGTPGSGSSGGLGGIKTLPKATLQMNVSDAPLDEEATQENKATDDIIWGKR